MSSGKSSASGRGHSGVVSGRHLEPPAGYGLGQPLRPGEVRQRPAVNRSQATEGVAPLTALNTQRFQSLPVPLGKPPYHYALATVVPDVEATTAKVKQLVFHMVGDTGGVKQPASQAAVAAVMKGDLLLGEAELPRFFYHLGDVVYYNGQIADYYDQFYEPYDHYGPPILAIPGNHDGDPADTTQVSLDGWVRYFMNPVTQVNPESHDAPRATLSLPNPYFTLDCPFVTIVGMYTNVPEGGSIDSVQQQWLTHELATAPQDKALIVAMHHPIYSFDDHHSGSARMADALQHAINDSRRVPNLVLAAHVHNYQRIEREVVTGSKTPFIVAGMGGYYHLHGMNIPPAAAGGLVSHGKHVTPVADAATGANLIYSNHTNHGYCTLTVTAEAVTGKVNFVEGGKYPAQAGADTFTYSAKAMFLAKDQVVSL